MRAIPRGLTIVCGVVVVLVLLPIGVTIAQAFQGGTGAAADALRASGTLWLLRNTLLVAAASLPICAVIGVAAAWFVERTQLPARRLWALLLVAPLTVSCVSWSLGSIYSGRLPGVLK